MLLADLMQQEAVRRKFAVGRQSFRIGGVVDAAHGPNGLYMVAVLDINDASGKRLHRIVDDGLRPKGEAIGYADLQRLAAHAVSKLIVWHEASNAASGRLAEADTGVVPYAGIDDRLATPGIDTTGSIDAPAAFPTAQGLSFDIAMGPAPGDGAEALKAALADELRRQFGGRSLPGGRYAVSGYVTVATVVTGYMGVSIRWLVKTPDGRLVGAVTQTQAVGPDRIVSCWGDLAKNAAKPAAQGILALVRPAPRLPGNAS